MNKVILFWSPFDGRWDYYVGFGQRPFVEAGCPVTKCFLTDDHRLLNVSDVVLFTINDLRDVPTHRFDRQRFVFYQMEPPSNTKEEHFSERSRIRFNYFNWTMTYRTDSDIVQRDAYGAIRPRVICNFLKRAFYLA